MIGLLAYGWAIHSGYATEDIQAIVATGSGVVSENPEAPTTAPPFNATQESAS
jgi:hypothetical protein